MDYILPIGGILFTILIVFLTLGPPLRREFEADRIIKEGVATAAHVKDIRPTGHVYSDEPEVRITLDVRVPGGETFEAEVTTVFSVVYLPRFQPGAIVPVCFDRNDRRKVALVKSWK